MSIQLLISGLQGMQSNKQLHIFAADCAERVYKQISMLDGDGVLQETLDAARSGDPDRLAEAYQAARRFTRELRRSTSSNSQQLLRAARAVRSCAKPDAKDAAIATCSSVLKAVEDKDEEVKWQVRRLRNLVA